MLPAMPFNQDRLFFSPLMNLGPARRSRVQRGSPRGRSAFVLPDHLPPCCTEENYLCTVASAAGPGRTTDTPLPGAKGLSSQQVPKASCFQLAAACGLWEGILLFNNIINRAVFSMLQSQLLSLSHPSPSSSCCFFSHHANSRSDHESVRLLLQRPQPTGMSRLHRAGMSPELPLPRWRPAARNLRQRGVEEDPQGA